MRNVVLIIYYLAKRNVRLFIFLIRPFSKVTDPRKYALPGIKRIRAISTPFKVQRKERITNHVISQKKRGYIKLIVGKVVGIQIKLTKSPQTPHYANRNVSYHLKHNAVKS